jgi:hypothetical protein
VETNNSPEGDAMDMAPSMQRLSLSADCHENIVDDTEFMLQRLDQCFERMAQHCAKAEDNQPLVDLYGNALSHVSAHAVADLGPGTCRNIMGTLTAMLDKLVS